jgi:bacillithiol system protein YtxJ
MNWNALNSPADLDHAVEVSQKQKVMLFKHSTRCSISAAALGRLERNWQANDSQKIVPFFLDLIQHRDVSNLIASRFGVEHESPQVLVIENGKCIYHNSHQGIDYKEIIKL